MMRLTGYILVAAICLPTIALANNIGSVAEQQGNGGIERGRDLVGSGIGTEIQSMDAAVTTNGTMRIDFIDDTRVDITQHSKLIIDEFVYDPANNIGSVSLKASLGTVRYASGQIAKRYQQNVKIRTPSATIGVRGTDFVMVVDEIGGSLITLLPSCDSSGACYTGEITVETDAGFVVMNQAFQATVTTTSAQAPTPPKLLDLPEDMINSLLIIRKKVPYIEDEEEYKRAKRQAADILGIDYLEFDGLDFEQIQTDEEIWHTELDETDFMLGDLLVDILEQLNIQLAELFKSEFEKQKVNFSGVRLGFDQTTGVRLTDKDPLYQFERYDNAGTNNVNLQLHKGSGGYTINLQQGDFQLIDYRIGTGPNTIDIKQAN
ncbi:MAG: FecR family protein [Methylophagaceae bacterium]|jgi:hypothetical protein|tara:strand:+ start:829 stop:1956 length:1128 start_codon:yes stop_codon:yes gene_type:complete